ncbi:hypothetical protein [Gracilibacillus phocaeensis]|uniref:hypothetical protein n=1 Tax=Gracilibacillus phocaeensis TaxID=2042304 RepID=UPI0013EF00FD|nr:hypothetical protein [Gracilibacillus phocaeensis]
MNALVHRSGSQKMSSVSSNKLKKISIKPKVKDGKLLLSRKKSDHRYIVEDD